MRLRWVFAAACVGLLAAVHAADTDLTLSDKGYSVHFIGPAGTAVQVLAAALGISPGPAGISLPREELNKQVSITVDNARLYDLLEQVGKAIGHPIDVTGYIGVLRVRPDQWTEDQRPRASTDNYDLVLDLITYTVRRMRKLDARLGRVQPSETQSVSVRIQALPASPAASARFVAFAPTLTLTGPDGSKVDVRRNTLVRTPLTMVADSPAVAGVCTLEVMPPPSALKMPGEYVLAGEIILANTTPKPVVFELPGDVGKTVQVGPAKLTLAEWRPELKEIIVKIERPQAPMMRMPPTVGPMWPVRVQILDADGRAIASRSLSVSRNMVRAQVHKGEPAKLVIWGVASVKPKDTVREAFQLKFTVPRELLRGAGG